MDFWINDPEAAKILGNDRGVPVTEANRNLLQEEAGPVEEIVYNYTSLVSEATKTEPFDVSYNPPGFAEFSKLAQTTTQEIGFGRKTWSRPLRTSTTAPCAYLNRINNKLSGGGHDRSYAGPARGFRYRIGCDRVNRKTVSRRSGRQQESDSRHRADGWKRLIIPRWRSAGLHRADERRDPILQEGGIYLGAGWRAPAPSTRSAIATDPFGLGNHLPRLCRSAKSGWAVPL